MSGSGLEIPTHIQSFSIAHCKCDKIIMHALSKVTLLSYQSLDTWCHINLQRKCRTMTSQEAGSPSDTLLWGTQLGMDIGYCDSNFGAGANTRCYHN